MLSWGSPSGTTTGTFGNVEINPNVAPLSTPDLSLDIVQNTMQSEIRIYPNPATDEAWIDLGHHFNQKVDIEVFNNIGQSVLQVPASAIKNRQAKLNTQHWENGLYLVRIRIDDQEVITKKLIRQQ